MNSKAVISGLIILACAYYLTSLAAPKMFYIRGKALYEKQNYPTAVKYLNQALVFNPNNTDYRYYYVKSLSELKPAYDVQKTIFEFSKSSKDDGAKILAGELLREWKMNINRNIGNNYIEQAPSDSKIIRWNKNSFPLKVYIEGISGLPEYYKSAIGRAFSQWEKSVDFVRFVSAKKPADAQILILFRKLPENSCPDNVCKYIVGFTTPKIHGKKLKSMTITVYDTNPGGEYFSDKEIYNTVLHELGHALGIMGHSYSTDDLMYQQAQEQTSIFAKYREDFHYLTGNDVNTMRLLYMLEPEITDKAPEKEGLIYTPVILGSPQEIAEAKVREALDYIEASPGLAAGYISLAGAYADLKEYNKAINALNNAMDLTNSKDEKFIIYYNFACVYLNMKNYDTALEYAKLAQRIQPSEDVSELISVIEHNKNIKKISKTGSKF